MRIADGANDFFLKIFFSSDIIIKLLIDRVPEHPVDRKIPSLGIFFRGGFDDLCGAPSIVIAAFLAEGGHFKMVSSLNDNDNPKRDADGDGLGEQGLHFFDSSARSNIDII